ncbi:MAG: 2-amino-4-hydroxy-6-hydroxymethyldihydropteridine diphosphokinase [Candidatus Omnitrophica bacterium]|nr:2-amino-4-hydroxy-6-hydroxymethyldihydropteridine diphosphokinase [Candidatus Omnitrophota bacterium]
MPTNAFIAAGSNLGNRLEHIRSAQRLVAETPEVKFLAGSAIHETMPQGGPPQGLFLNSVWKIETSLDPQALLKLLQSIEKKLGRVRAVSNGPRIIDLDLLDYDGQVVNEEGLTLPHPRLHERVFVLRPLSEVAPEWIHPVLKKRARELWVICHSRESGNPGFMQPQL